MKLYKLTDQDYKTRTGETNETLWGENVTHTAKGKSNELCSDGLIHAYTHPILAALFNPIHAEISSPVLWECETECDLVSDNLKCGVKSLTTIRVIPLPEITTEQKVTFAILCAKKVCKDKDFLKWADNWLNGNDRSCAAAREAAAEWAEWAAAAAECAAARCAAAAEWAAARCAAAAARAMAEININFIEIAKEAGITYEENL